MPVLNCAAAVVAGIAGSIVTTRYRRDLHADRASLHAAERSVLDTAFGTVEHAQAGDGPPVLTVHGVLGGCDFGVRRRTGERACRV